MSRVVIILFNDQHKRKQTTVAAIHHNQYYQFQLSLRTIIALRFDTIIRQSHRQRLLAQYPVVILGIAIINVGLVDEDIRIHRPFTDPPCEIIRVVLR